MACRHLAFKCLASSSDKNQIGWLVLIDWSEITRNLTTEMHRDWVQRTGVIVNLCLLQEGGGHLGHYMRLNGYKLFFLRRLRIRTSVFWGSSFIGLMLAAVDAEPAAVESELAAVDAELTSCRHRTY